MDDDCKKHKKIRLNIILHINLSNLYKISNLKKIGF